LARTFKIVLTAFYLHIDLFSNEVPRDFLQEDLFCGTSIELPINVLRIVDISTIGQNVSVGIYALTPDGWKFPSWPETAPFVFQRTPSAEEAHYWVNES